MPVVRLRRSISDILRCASFLGAVCVVAIHANVDGCWSYRALTFWAVPYFFLVSGFFFGISSYVRNGGDRGYGQLLHKKVRGLFIPYIVWSLIALVIGTPLVVMNNYIYGHSLLDRTVFEGRSVLTILDATFGICRDSPQPLGVLWFVRTLMFFFF